MRQHVYIQLKQIKELAEDKAYNKAEHIGRNKFFAQIHQAGDKQSLENVGPGTECKLGKGFTEGKGNAADGADAGTGVEHEHNAEAVDDYCN